MEGPVERGWNLGAALAQRDLSLCSGEASCAEPAHRSQDLHSVTAQRSNSGLQLTSG